MPIWHNESKSPERAGFSLHRAGGRLRGIFSFLGKRISPFDPQEKGSYIANEQFEEMRRLPNRLPAIFVAIRFDFLLSSLSLCLRFGSLTQFPPTLDLYRFAIACRGGFAGARRSTHYQDDMHCQMIRLHQNKMSRAAADDRSTLSRIAGINAALPRAGITFRRQKTCASPRLPIKTLSLGGCKGGYSLSAEREYPPLVLRRARRIFPPRSARKATAPPRERKKEAAL